MPERRESVTGARCAASGVPFSPERRPFHSRRNVMNVRSFGKSAAIAMVAAMPLVFAGSGAAESQPNMGEAIAYLEKGLAALKAAAPDKGGHRANAIQLVERAISETRAGIAYDNRHQKK
jgi:hypothetical protein